MGKFISWEERLCQFREIHSNKYEYPAVSDSRSITKLRIKCPIHGIFFQTIKKHIKGQGCPQCGRVNGGKKRRLTLDTFIAKSKNVHNNFYNYDNAVYTGLEKEIVITCPIHGDFTTTPATHMRGHSCPDCALIKARLNQTQIIADFKRIHGDKYDYSKVIYSNLRDKITIICPIHGEFQQQAGNHRNGSGCPYCGGIRAYWETFIANCNRTHENKYIYPDQEFHDVSQKIKIICPIHGEFFQVAAEHQYKYGCSKCGGTNKHTQEEILAEFKQAHGDTYDYSAVEYETVTTKVKIICRKHGPFLQRPSYHMRGGQCPMCSNHVSREERDLLAYIREKTNNIIVSDRKLISPLELDIVLPDLKIAIEYNGLYWHSSAQKDNMYHKHKMDSCNKAGYRLINIWQDDWLHRQLLVKSFIANLFGESFRIYARKTIFKEIPKSICRNFLINNHIQGSSGISRAFGLYYNGELVTATAFIKRGSGSYELTRHACKLETTVIGALGKVIKNSYKLLAPATIYSFCDLSMYTGKSYIAAGFKQITVIPPDYKYVIGTERKHKFNFRRHNLANFLGTRFKSEFSEIVNMETNGYHRIFDCGKVKYVYTYR